MSHRDVAGDEQLTPSQRDFVRANLHVLDDVIHRHFACHGQSALPRLRSLGTPALIDAARRYDATRGVQFRTYAWKRIRGAIRDGLRGERPCESELVQRGVVSADEHAAWQEDSSEARGDTEEQAAARFRKALGGYAAAWAAGWEFGGPADDAETLLQRAARERMEAELWSTCTTLPERDQRVLELRDRQGLSWPEVARAMNVSEATAHRHHHAAMDRLGERLRGQLGHGSAVEDVRALRGALP